MNNETDILFFMVCVLGFGLAFTILRLNALQRTLTSIIATTVENTSGLLKITKSHTDSINSLAGAVSLLSGCPPAPADESRRTPPQA